MYWRSTRYIGKLFSCVRIRCIDAQLEILEIYLAALELDVLTLNNKYWKFFSCVRIRYIDAQLEILESYLATLESDVLTLN